MENAMTDRSCVCECHVAGVYHEMPCDKTCIRCYKEREPTMTTNTTLPILDGLVKLGLLQSFKLETLQEVPGEHSREHDRLTLVFPNGEPLVIDTVCSGC